MVYQIRIYVDTPIIVTGNLHFDALLHYVHPGSHNGYKSVTRQTPIDMIKSKRLPLPIDSIRCGDSWCWACTCAAYADNAQPYSSKYTRAHQGRDIHYLRSRLIHTNGIHKDVMASVYGVSTPYVDFWASTSNIKELQRIAKRIKSIGTYAKNGYGQVRSMDIESVDIPYQDVVVANGTARRNMPIGLVDTIHPQQVPIDTPYWHPDNLVQGVAAGSGCKLREDVQLIAAK